MRNRIALLGRSKTLLVALVAAVALAVIGTSYGYAKMNKEITLSLDGETKTVSSTGSTVGDVLDDQDITIGEHDQVAPGLDEKVSEGTRISVQFGRQLKLTVDGVTSSHWVHSTDVDAALAELGRSYDKAELSTSRSSDISRDGLSLRVVTPKKLTIQVGAGKRLSKNIAAFTVGDVLDELGVKADKNDIVKPKRSAKLKKGTDITVTKVRVVRKHVDDEAISHETVEKADDTMYDDESETVREGRDGARDVTYRLEYRNGKLFATKVVSAEVTRKPVDEIVSVGTKERPEPEPTTNYSSGNSVWDRLAACESGGNWAANTGNGYYGGLQFSASTWHAVGGSGLPHQNSREEQIKRGQILQSQSGWGQWPACSAALGLR